MSELKCKLNVRPRTLFIAAAVINAANELELHMDMVISSGNDSNHMIGSKHYKDEALDFRTKTLTNVQIGELVKIIKRRLGKSYQVIIEDELTPNEHMHIEYDPKPEKVKT